MSPGVAAIPPWLPVEETVGPEGDTNLFVHYSSFEEKGSDVNVATRLLADVLERRIGAAIVMSNDGDLSLPLRIVRQHVPIGLVNPTARPLSQMLKGVPHEGVGGHWWLKLASVDFFAHQSPASIGGFNKPSGW